MNKTIRSLLVAVCVILILVFLYSGYRLTRIIHDYREADHYYSAQTGKYASFADTSANAQGGSPSSPNRPSGLGELDELQEISPRAVDFDALLSTCPDVKGWLYSPNTAIDYPVVQGKDNDYYLHRFMDGTYNPAGTLFIDYRCPGDFSGRHTVIYGHHMQNGTMFNSLDGYRKQEYFDEHSVMYLNTPEGNYRLDIFSGFVTWYDSRVYLFDFFDDAEFEEWYTLMQSFSDFTSNVTLSPDDHIVTFSTCTYDYDNARYVVMAKLVPIG